MRKLLLGLAAGIFAGVVGLAIAPAQTIGPTNLSGNECWNAGQGPGGITTSFLCLNAVRGSESHVLGTVTGATTLGAGTTAALAYGGDLLISAQPSAAVITLPANPVPDGAIIRVCNVTGSAFTTNAVTLAANSGQTLSVAATLTTLGAGTCASEIFHRATTTWYRIQ